MKIYTFYTESHKSLLENFFIPSLFKYESPSLVVENLTQKCQTATYMKQGWLETMMDKVNLIIKAIKDNYGNVFIYSDCDIIFCNQFVKDCLDKLNNKDIVFQTDNVSDACCGFMVISANKNSYNFFNLILQNIHKYKDDQAPINEYLKNQETPITYNLLDNLYYNLYFDLKGKALNWDPFKDQLPNIPSNIKIFHANWIIGIEKKYKTLELIQNLKK